MLTVRDLLKIKGDSIWAVSPETSTLDALRFMAEKNIGAVLVVEEGLLRGIISERDFARRIAKSHNCAIDEPIEEYMTTDLITVRTDQTIQDCMQLMSTKHIRHLPVVDGSRLLGLISIRDVVDAIIGEQSSLINNLEDYIVGGGYGK